MEFQYLKELEKNNLSYSDLPDDAQTGIDQIKDIEKALLMLEKRGKNPTQKTIKKIKAMDKWVCYEIYDFLHETDKNEDEIPYEEDEVIDEIKDQIEEPVKEEKVTDPKGLKIEEELKNLSESGKSKFQIEELRDLAPTTYDCLFDTYEPDEENGVETSRYKLIEKENETFYLSKN